MGQRPYLSFLCYQTPHIVSVATRAQKRFFSWKPIAHSTQGIYSQESNEAALQTAATNLPRRDEAKALSAPGGSRAAPWGPPFWSIPKATPVRGVASRERVVPVGRHSAPPPVPAVGAARNSMAAAFRIPKQVLLQALRCLVYSGVGGSCSTCCCSPLGGIVGFGPWRRGGMRHKGPLHPSGHHFGERTVLRLLTGLDQPSVPSPSGCAWVKWCPMAVMDARGPGNPGTMGLGSWTWGCSISSLGVRCYLKTTLSILGTVLQRLRAEVLAGHLKDLDL